MGANCTVYFPAAACDGFPNPREAVRALLGEALETGLAPRLDLPTTDLVRVGLYLSSGLAAQLQSAGGTQNAGLEQTAAGLAYAGFLHRRDGAPAVPLPHGPPSPDDGLPTRDNRVALQARLRAPLMEGLRQEKIVFAEGGTGLGKSRVIAQCALEYLRGHAAAKVLVMAPTVSVLAHLVHEFREVAPPEFTAFSVVLGRNQFVSSGRLESLLGSPCPSAEIKVSWQAAAEWFEGGGRSEVEPRADFLRDFPLCWLADDLRRIAPQFPTEDVLLGGSGEGDADDPAQTVYQGLRVRAFDEEVRLVFATQAMACLNVWSLLRPDRQPGILPPFDLLLIDEAHELEEIMARTIGSSVSLLHMRQVLRQGVEQALWQKFALTTAASEALTHLDKAERLLHQIPSSGLLNSWNDADADGSGRKKTFDKFLVVARDLAASLQTMTNLEDVLAGELPLTLLREWHRALRQMLDGRQNVWVDFSPVVRTPRLTVGPSQLIRPFEELWRSCRAAGLLSGTLYLPNADGKLSSGFLRMKLRVPRERAQDIDPVHPAWIFSTPTLYLPRPEAAGILTYPGTAEDGSGTAEAHRWHQAVAERLLEVSRTAAGGTLVLCCSYLDIRALSALLADTLGERLLSSRGGSSAATLAKKFVGLGRQAVRPVWLATGSAWTGLDLADREARLPVQDNLLTDLVVTRVPFGMNKTAVHLARIKRLGFDVEAMDAALRLKQGLGRLVRREGVTDRRIWMLDGRAQGRRSGYFKRVFGQLLFYPKREMFS